ncbi:hypothetical protein VrSk94_10470 [Vibrio rotiferianus]
MLRSELEALTRDMLQLIKELRFDEISSKFIDVSSREKNCPINSDVFAHLALKFRKLPLEREFNLVKQEVELNRKLQAEEKKYLKCKEELLDYFTWFNEHLIFKNETGRVFASSCNKGTEKICQKMSESHDLPLSSELIQLIEEQLKECSSYEYQHNPWSNQSCGWVIKSGFFLDYVEKVEHINSIKGKLKQLKSIEKKLTDIRSKTVYELRSKPELDCSTNVSIYVRGVSNMVRDALTKIS